METPEWLFGPSGDLRPLPVPEPGLANTVERFGGIHQAINGARTVDTFGFRAGYEFELEFLEPEESFRLEALYTQTLPGPLKLIDPLRKNLLSREAAVSKNENYSGHGLSWAPYTNAEWVRITDSPVSWNQRAAKWSILSDGGYMRFDGEEWFIPTRPDKPLTFSVYLHPSASMSVYLSFDTFSNGEQIGTVDAASLSLTAGEWTRVVNWFPFATEVDEVRPVLWVVAPGPADAESLLVLAPQVEYGTEATSPSLGGAVTTVVIESMESTSPRYPYQSVTLSLLEV